MKQVMLPDGTSTSQIGFGCANLLGGSGLEHSRSLVHAALDAGIRHFDVAPIYGSGLAEDALGEALRGLAEPVTITTKVGLARPAAPVASNRARVVAKAVLRMMPGLKEKLGRKVYSMTRRKAFAVEDVAASFEESLRRLGRERVDVLLLHAPDPEDVSEELLRWLERVSEEGRVGVVGFGVSRVNVDAITAAWPAAEFVQTSWAAGDPVIDVGGRFLSTHGAIRAIGRVRAMLAADAGFRDRLSEIAGADLDSTDALVKGLLGAALANNSGGLTLVATSRVEHIHALADVSRRHPTGAARLAWKHL